MYHSSIHSNSARITTAPRANFVHTKTALRSFLANPIKFSAPQGWGHPRAMPLCVRGVPRRRWANV
eukprot:10908823-Lingulodinium_polyedra.AAC.1